MADLMKGFVFKDYADKIKYPVIVEPKIDEIRCRVKRTPTGVDFLSYANKPLGNLENFTANFAGVLDTLGVPDLDMGVEVNGNFNDSYRWVRSKRIPEGLHLSMVQFHLYDIPALGTRPYQDRVKVIHEIVLPVFRVQLRRCRTLPVLAPDKTFADSEKRVLELYRDFRFRGYEGAMVKDPHGLYTRKRSAAWLKLKPKETGDGQIVAVNRAYSIEGVPLDRAGSVSFITEAGIEGRCHGIPHVLGAHMLTHPEDYINRWVEFNYMEIDRAGGFRHPTFIRIREDKA